MSKPGPKLGAGRQARALSMVALRLDGYTVKDIGNWYGCTHQNVTYLTRQAAPKMALILNSLRHPDDPKTNP